VINAEPRDRKTDERQRWNGTEQSDDGRRDIVEYLTPRQGNPDGDTECRPDDGAGDPVLDTLSERRGHLAACRLDVERFTDCNRRRQDVLRLEQRGDVPQQEKSEGTESTEQRSIAVDIDQRKLGIRRRLLEFVLNISRHLSGLRTERHERRSYTS
jgi:hypothetical protein